MPSKKRVGDHEEKTNETKKRRIEKTTEVTGKLRPEEQMDESVKSLPKECPDCKSGNHRFWMFANYNSKQPRYKCLNNNCPRAAYTVGGKVCQKKAQGVGVKNAGSTPKAKVEKSAKTVPKFCKKPSFVSVSIGETVGNNQETTEVDTDIDVEGVSGNNDFGETSNSSGDSNETSCSSDSDEASSASSESDETSSASSESDEISSSCDSDVTFDASNESMDGENNFNDEECEHLVPKMTRAEIKIADEAEEEYSFCEEYANKDGEEIELLTFVEYRNANRAVNLCN